MLRPMRGLLFCVLVACGGSQPAPASPPPPTSAAPAPVGSATPAAPPAAGSATGLNPETLIAKMSEFKDKICACPDQTCAEGVATEMQTWGNEMQKAGAKNLQLTDDQSKRVTDVANALGVCMKRISNMGN